MSKASERIRAQLRKLLKENRGQVLTIEATKLGGHGRVSRWARGQRALSLERLDQVLDAFDADPVRFFAEAFDLAPGPAVGSGPWLLDVLALSNQSEHASIRKLRCAAKTLPAIKDAIEAHGDLPVIEELDEIEELRFSSPEASAGLAHQFAIDKCPELPPGMAHNAFCRAVGAFASAHRIAASHVTAAQALAIGMAQPKLTPLIQGDCLRRMTTLLISYARYEEALDANARAMSLFQMEASPYSLGQAMVDRGSALIFSGDYQRAEYIYKAGLALLPETDSRHRAATYQGFAQIELYGGGCTERARDLIERAQPLIGQTDHYGLGMMAWFRGAIYQQKGELREAESSLREAQAYLSVLNVFDWGLATLDLIEVTLERGGVAEANQIALAVARLLEPRSSNEIATSAMHRLLEVRRTTAGLDVPAIEVARVALHKSKRLGLVRDPSNQLTLPAE